MDNLKNALIFLTVPLSEFGKYYHATLAMLPPEARIDVLATEPVERFDTYPEYSRLHLVTCEKALNELSTDEAELNLSGKHCYDSIFIPCLGDTAISYENLARVALRLTSRRIIFLYNKVFNILDNDVIEAREGILPEESAEFKLKLFRVLKRGISEIHTSYICIHPYYGYVCKPNSVVDFGMRPPKEFGHSVSITTDKHGFRNSEFPERKPEDEYWIGLFGGSVAFSMLSTDNSTTISGYLEKEINAVSPRKRIRVLNLALPGAQQPQQTIIYLNFVQYLDGIITFDGANETMVAAYNANTIPSHFPYLYYYTSLFMRPSDEERAALTWILGWLEDKRYRHAPRMIKLLAGIFNKKLVTQVKGRLNKIIAAPGSEFTSLFMDGPVTHVDEILKAGARSWSDHIRYMRHLAAIKNAECLFVLQPIPEIGKLLTEVEKNVAEKTEYTLELKTKAYSLLSQELLRLRQDGVECEDFTCVFEDVSDSIYGDAMHFEDRGCEIVAKKIAEIIKSRWRIFS